MSEPTSNNIQQNMPLKKSNNVDKNQQNLNYATHQEFHKYLDWKKELYQSLISFLENPNSNEKDFQNLIEIIGIQNHKEDREEFENFLKLIANISSNHHYDKLFFEKIFQIIIHYIPQIKQIFSNFEIYCIFEENLKVLLFLFESKIISIDDQIYEQMIFTQNQNEKFSYCHFFYPEITKFLGEEKTEDIKKELLSLDSNIFDEFDRKRHEGENDSIICSLIREDSIQEFNLYVQMSGIKLNRVVKHSIFETNLFLIMNPNTTLIEYSAFFGALKIFNYLHYKKVSIKPRIWLFAIHSQCASLIHLLDEY